QHAEERGNLERLQIVGVGEQRPEVLEADELGALAERVLQLERVPAGLHRGPEEEHDGDRDLRGHQRIRQPRRPENDPLFHYRLLPTSYLLAASNCRRISLPRFTASSSAALASFFPENTFSSSSSITVRPCTKLPKRRPLEFSVGALLVSWRVGMSAPGFLS